MSGNVGYLAQFNPFRATSRRAPEAMIAVNQPFDPQKFNFNKVSKDKELVFSVQGLDDICIINVSPIEFGHCLFLPEVGECHPQVRLEQISRHARFLMRD